MSASLVSNNINEQLDLYLTKTNDPSVYQSFIKHIPSTNSTYRYYIPFNYFKKDTLSFLFNVGASGSVVKVMAGFVQPDGTEHSVLSIDIPKQISIFHSFLKGVFYIENGTTTNQAYNDGLSLSPFSTPFLEFQNITSSSNVVLTCNSLVDWDILSPDRLAL